MNTRPMHVFSVLVVLLALAASLLQPAAGATAQISAPPNSSATETAEPSSLSPEAELALEYAAAQAGVARQDLTLLDEHDLTLPTLDRRFRAVAISTPSGDLLRVLVDLKTREVIGDASGLEQQEAEAYTAKYGKLHPLLYERLQTAAAGEKLPVAVWFAHDLPAAQQRFWELLAKEYPAVDEARRQQRSLPFVLEDPALSEKVRQEYEDLLAQELQRVVAPIARTLRDQGVEVQEFRLLPSVATVLTKAQISQLAELPSVQAIFLVEDEGQSALNTATATDRIPRVWTSGYDGTGRTIAVVEIDNIDDHASLNLSPIRRNGIGDTEFPRHADRTAMAAASMDSTYPGVARGATILNAGIQVASTMPNEYNSVNWALDNGADVVNISYGYYSNTPYIEWIDGAVDYAVRSRGDELGSHPAVHR